MGGLTTLPTKTLATLRRLRPLTLPQLLPSRRAEAPPETIWRGFTFALACPHKPQADSRNCRTSDALVTHSEMRCPSSSTSR
ncbi:hypothetical protein GCM10012280_07330 [Wenjunlia tyrosinilytica]|uniref:Uncharacterized protein n=1 Tax=Wenjunlia tyrosinilytica TaxID=1544741 RepID=A0A917ZEK9_9ACTN|nr:hypothetical protein GCM10012280_07330 [Wenjunlia tyrosinilytica]